MKLFYLNEYRFIILSDTILVESRIKGVSYSLNNIISTSAGEGLEKVYQDLFAFETNLLKQEDAVVRLWIDLIPSSSLGW